MKSSKEVEERLDAIVARHKAAMAKHGFTVQAVLPNEDEPPYTYTIGLSHSLDHPEIFIVGMRPDSALDLIADIVEQIKHGVRFDKPVFAPGIIPGWEIPFRPLSDEAVLDNADIGLELLGPFSGVQMFYPDPDGFAPWDEECDPRYKGQEIFDLEGDAPARNISLDEARSLVQRQSPLTPEQIAENRRRIIGERRKEVEEHGFVPQAVGGGPDTPGFLYTIGLTKTWKHPEIYVVALNPEQAFGIVSDLVDRIAEGERFDTPLFVDEVLTVPIALRPINQEAVGENSGIAEEVLGYPITAVQAFWPDENGLMPWEDGCDPEVADIQFSIFTPEGAEPVRRQPPPGVGIH